MHYACHANISLIINLTIGPLAPAVAQRGRGGRGQARGSGHGPKRSQCRQTCSASSWLPVLWWSRSRQSTAAIHPESSPWYALCSSHAETPWPGLLIIFFFHLFLLLKLLVKLNIIMDRKIEADRRSPQARWKSWLPYSTILVLTKLVQA